MAIQGNKAMFANSQRGCRALAPRITPLGFVMVALLLCGLPQTTLVRANQGLQGQSPGSDVGFAQFCTNPHFPVDTPTIMDSTTCGVAGNGGAETWQNEAKNNFCAPDPAKPVTIQDLAKLQTAVEQDQTIPFGNTRNHPLTSNPGPAKDRTALVGLGEGSQVVLQGYVLIARQEGAESVNCGSHVPNASSYHDIHISIVQNASDDECSGVVAEMVPHHRPTVWNRANVQSVANAKLSVRVTGQLMFDSSHSPCSNGVSVPGDPSRASLWEVHPIYKFEVCPQGDCSSGDGWLSLEDWKKTQQ